MALRFTIVVLLLCTVIAFGYTKSSNLRVEIQPKKKVLTLGGSVEIKCSISGDIAFDVRVRWQKKQDREWIMIGEDDNANEQFRRTRRYDLTLGDGDEQTIFFSLTITNVTTADTGIYGCFTEGINRTSALIVLGPVKKVTLTAKNSSKEIFYSPKEGSSLPVKCVVNSSSPAVVISILLKGTRDTVNITERFKTPWPVLKSRGDPGLIVMFYQMTLSGIVKSSDFKHQEDKQLTCEVQAEGYKTKTQTVFVHIISTKHGTTTTPRDVKQSGLHAGNGQVGNSCMTSSFLVALCLSTGLVWWPK